MLFNKKYYKQIIIATPMYDSTTSIWPVSLTTQVISVIPKICSRGYTVVLVCVQYLIFEI